MPHEEAAMTYVCMNDFRDAAELTLVIRDEAVVDVAARERLLDAAFGPARFAKTCERLREGRAPAQGLALAAYLGDELVGTIRFWHIQAGAGHAALLLGPVAVDARHRSLGIGRKLIAEGLFRAVQRGHKAVILVGDAAYYEPLGFSRAMTRGLALPGPVDEARFLGLELDPGALAGAEGLIVPTGPRAPRVAPALQAEPLRRAA
ncbi:MAG: putative N-acetyltransferase YhbS [Hyphomicrobiales bacterium]|nr:putative N-acetyltransferase YhbS [Hyphomicrobiales bacterium]